MENDTFLAVLNSDVSYHILNTKQIELLTMEQKERYVQELRLMVKGISEEIYYMFVVEGINIYGRK